MRILDRLLGARPLATVAIEFFDDGRSSVRIEHRGVEPDLELDVDVSLFCWYYAFVLFLVSKEPEVALALCGEVRTGSEEIVKAQAHAANRPSVADCTLIDDAPGPAIAVLSATVFE